MRKSIPSLAHVLSLALLLLAIEVHSHASEGPPPILQPRTVYSPSREFSLFVNPADQHGVGSAKCTLKRGDEVVWSKDLPYAFWEVALADDGRAAGYAYSLGYQGWGDAGDSFGDLIVALVGADGNEIAHEITKRKSPEGMWSCPPTRDPSPHGIVFQPELDRFIIRRSADPGNFTSRAEKWYAYSLKTGQPETTFTLEYPGPVGKKNEVVSPWYMAMDADAVPGTVLTLVLWSRTDWKPQQAGDEGVRLSLVDAEGKEVWHEERADEFNGIPNFRPWYLKDRDVTPAERFSTGRFVYLSHKSQSELAFTVTKEDGVWKVVEAGTAPQKVQLDPRAPIENTDAAVAAAPEAAPLPSLQFLGEVELAAPSADDNLRIFAFAFDDKGNCGFVRFDPNGQDEFMLIPTVAPDPIKSAIRVPLAPAIPRGERSTRTLSAWVGGARWVLVNGSFDNSVPARAWTVDTAASPPSITPIDGFSGPAISTGNFLVGGGAHGFGVIGAQGFWRFDSRGKQIDTLEPGTRLESACYRTDGSVGLLVNVFNLLLTFDPAGKPIARVKLDEALPSKPQYLVAISPDAGGGWLVHDFGAKQVHRVKRQGLKDESLSPHYADGRKFRLAGDVCRAPDGRLWTSDGAALLRITDLGEVDLAIGSAPDSDALSEISAATTDASGRIYVLDRHTNLTHVFESSGKRVRTLRPSATDFGTDVGSGSITIAGEGEVYCRASDFGRPGYLHFDAAGNRLGFEPARSTEVRDEWLFRPGGRECLVLGYERAFLYDAGGKRVRTIERHADERWLGNPRRAAVAPDGSFAILAEADGRSQSRAVTLFSPAGDPITTHNIASNDILARVAACDRGVAVLAAGDLFCIDRATGKTQTYKVPIPRTAASWHLPFFSPDGREVWILDTGQKRVLRYRGVFED